MTAVARARIPWAAVGVSALTAGMVGVVAVTPPSTGIPPFLVRVAELALASAGAYLIDDAAAVVTATAPRSFWRRRATTVAAGVAAILAAWGCILVLVQSQGAGFPLAALSLELAVLCLVGFTAAAVLRWRGDPEPGSLVAPAVMLLGLAAVIGEQVFRVSVFVPHGGIVDTTRQTVWAAGGLLCLLITSRVLRDPARH
jgi:hypothetical protein